MVQNHKLPKSIPLHNQGLNYETNVCELENHVQEKGLNSNWSTKLGPTKKTPTSSFLSHLLESVWIESVFLYAFSPYHEEAMWNTIGVANQVPSYHIVRIMR